ncbi:MAG: PH domain-containing protein [Candidatus Sungbacteria bacterium]|uniref:PH domain-containing protein n=1 Tax=Candidatus Sungiibacteriota bacterium TaxID=2750080 RepID=A0A931SD85_9BACT|nr:PH domain-containing protein [Candidatus Sungbacteria bacterium]
MLSLQENETVVIVIRRHWWILVRPTIAFVVLLILPTTAAIGAAYMPGLGNFFAEPLGDFVTVLYLLILLLFAFLLWTDYYLDVWIVTSQRIIDIEQKSLFHRVISEIPMKRIQDVTIEINGIIETLLKFGDLRVQTAAEGAFTIKNAPHPHEAKDKILFYLRENTENLKHSDGAGL